MVPGVFGFGSGGDVGFACLIAFEVIGVRGCAVVEDAVVGANGGRRRRRTRVGDTGNIGAVAIRVVCKRFVGLLSVVGSGKLAGGVIAVTAREQ